jgi:hypothetical protein
MKSFDQLQSDIVKICSTEPPSTVVGTLWKLAEEESKESVLSAIVKSPDKIQDWLWNSIHMFYIDAEDNGRDEFCTVALVEGKIVEFGHFPKSWVQELKHVLKPDSSPR